MQILDLAERIESTGHPERGKRWTEGPCFTPPYDRRLESKRSPGNAIVMVTEVTEVGRSMCLVEEREIPHPPLLDYSTIFGSARSWPDPRTHTRGHRNCLSYQHAIHGRTLSIPGPRRTWLQVTPSIVDPNIAILHADPQVFPPLEKVSCPAVVWWCDVFWRSC